MIKKISTIIFLSLTALLPVLILFHETTWLTQNKFWLVFALSLTLLALWGWKIFHTTSFPLTHSPFTPALGLLTLAIIGSALFTHHAPIASLLGGGGVYLSMLIWAELGGQLTSSSLPNLFIKTLNISAALLSLGSILQLMGFGPSWLHRSPLVAAQLLGVVLIGIMIKLHNHLKQNKFITPLTWLKSALIAIGFLVNLYSILISPPTLTPVNLSWSVARGTLRSLPTALWGVGPDNYHQAEAQFRPAQLNQTQFWNVQFEYGSNLPLTLLVTTGLLGFAGWLWLGWRILKQLQRQPELKESPLTGILLTLLLSQLLLPPTSLSLIFFGLILAAWSAAATHSWSSSPRPTPPRWRLLAQVVGISLNSLFLMGIYGLGKASWASYLMFRATQAGRENQFVESYQLQQQAIQSNPYLASYRQHYALTNLALATALTNKTNLSQPEQAQILQLLQQALREAQLAAKLEPTDPHHWQVLAQIYTNLTQLTPTATIWVVSSYLQAISLAPTNPQLRLALGQTLAAVEQNSQAEALFTQAIELKPDLADAHYALATVLKKQHQWAAAATAYEHLLTLIEPDQAAYETINAELTQVKTQLALPSSSAKP